MIWCRLGVVSSVKLHWAKPRQKAAKLYWVCVWPEVSKNESYMVIKPIEKLDPVWEVIGWLVSSDYGTELQTSIMGYRICLFIFWAYQDFLSVKFQSDSWLKIILAHSMFLEILHQVFLKSSTNYCMQISVHTLRHEHTYLQH